MFLFLFFINLFCLSVLLIFENKMIQNLLYFLFIFDFVHCWKPEIVPFPPVFNVELHDSYELTCSLVHGSKPIQFEWFKNSLKFVSEHGITVDQKPYSSRLTFDQFNYDNSGNYSCRASNSDGFDQSTILLQIKGLFWFWFSLLFSRRDVALVLHEYFG